MPARRLPAPEIAARLDAIVLPPAAQGDIWRAVRRHRPAAIGLIDGLFRATRAVWHREILWALSEGVHVLGAASMGALRAAELHPYGMRGIGRVFEATVAGELEDDDEVAVEHAPAELGHAPLSTAMVDLRATLAAAEAGGALGRAASERLVARLKAAPYPQRSLALLEAEAGTDLAAWHVPRKRLDALALLDALAALAGAPPFVPAFRFQPTILWNRFVAEAEAEEAADVLDELRLDPPRWRAACLAAAGRAATQAPPPADLRAALSDFRAAPRPAAAGPAGALDGGEPARRGGADPPAAHRSRCLPAAARRRAARRAARHRPVRRPADRRRGPPRRDARPPARTGDGCRARLVLRPASRWAARLARRSRRRAGLGGFRPLPGRGRRRLSPGARPGQGGAGMRLHPAGTRVRLFPELFAGYAAPETAWLSPPPGSVGRGPADAQMYVANAAAKRAPYAPPGYLPPYDGAEFPAAAPDGAGHFDHIPVSAPQFLAVHLYGAARHTLDIWEHYLGHRVRWWHAPEIPLLELVPVVAWPNAHSGPGFLETGTIRNDRGQDHLFCLNFDVVAHEIGHAVLFATLGVPAPDAMSAAFLAFHESFSDLFGVIGVLRFASVVTRLLAQTGGNLHALNMVNRLGEYSDNQQVRLAANAVTMADVAGISLRAGRVLARCDGGEPQPARARRAAHRRDLRHAGGDLPGRARRARAGGARHGRARLGARSHRPGDAGAAPPPRAQPAPPAGRLRGGAARGARRGGLRHGACHAHACIPKR